MWYQSTWAYITKYHKLWKLNFFLTVLKARNLKSMFWQGRFHSEASWVSHDLCVCVGGGEAHIHAHK